MNQQYAIIENWTWGIEVEYAYTLDEAKEIQAKACDDSDIYQLVEEITL